MLVFLWNGSFVKQCNLIVCQLVTYLMYSLLGMKVAYKIFPEGLFTGTPPQSVTETPRTPGAHMEMAGKNVFDQEDLEKISIYLDNALCDKSSGSKLITYLLL